MRALKSVEESAGILGISKWTVRKDIREGRLKPVRLGRRVLLEEAELERFVASARTPPGSIVPNASEELRLDHPERLDEQGGGDHAER